MSRVIEFAPVAAPVSGNTESSQDNVIVRSASVIAKLAPVTCDNTYPDAVAENATVSWSSVTASERGDTVMSVDPLVAPDAIVTVADDGAE